MGAAAAGDLAGIKRDRFARLVKVVRVLEAYPDGVKAEKVGEIIGMSRRTAYRDLKALQDEVGVPVWSLKGLWGIEERAFLPKLRLTLHEAMVVFLSARLMASSLDTYDPDLAGAFLKLADILPPTVRSHVERTVDILARRRTDPDFTRRFRLLVDAWAERRIVELTYDAGAYDPARPPRKVRVHPWLIEPSAHAHALYLIGWDEEREARRTFKVDRIRDVRPTVEPFEPPTDGATEESMEQAWWIIADQGEVEVKVRFDRGVAARVAETVWHPTQSIERSADGSIVWSAKVSGMLEVRLWILEWGADAEVLAPAALREDVARTFRDAAARYGPVG
jgi:proteasome accessory factor B